MLVRQKKNKESGQAALEFIFVSVVLFFFLLFFLSFSILLVVSDYIDYATFMAARTYKTGASREASQRRNAQAVFDSYIAPVSTLVRNVNLQFDVRTDPNAVETTGVLASYDLDLFYLPPIFLKDGAPQSRIRLSSEAHLGREPSFEECQQFFSTFLQNAGVSNQAYADLMEDNGC